MHLHFGGTLMLWDSCYIQQLYYISLDMARIYYFVDSETVRDEWMHLASGMLHIILTSFNVPGCGNSG